MKGETNKLEQINFGGYRHPLIKDLQTALLNSKPINTLHFIRKWAKSKMQNQVCSDQDQNETNQPNRLQLIKQKDRTRSFHIKRRGAIMMANIDQNQHWNQFLLKEPMIKNEECKSRIMLSLRDIPFLVQLNWEDINYLVQIAEMRQYYENQIFINKDKSVNRLYILIRGQLKRAGNDSITFFNSGQSLFVESLISLAKTKHIFTVTSQSALICGIQSYRIYDLLQKVNIKERQMYEDMLMRVGLFSCLDRQQMDKLVSMLKKLPPFKNEEIVISKNQKISSIFFVIRGQFLLCKERISGQVTSFLNYKEGQYFGEDWITGQNQSQFTVMAKSEGVLGFIDKADIENAISQISKLVQRKKMKRLMFK